MAGQGPGSGLCGRDSWHARRATAGRGPLIGASDSAPHGASSPPLVLLQSFSAVRYETFIRTSPSPIRRPTRSASPPIRAASIMCDRHYQPWPHNGLLQLPVLSKLLSSHTSFPGASPPPPLSSSSPSLSPHLHATPPLHMGWTGPDIHPSPPPSFWPPNVLPPLPPFVLRWPPHVHVVPPLPPLVLRQSYAAVIISDGVVEKQGRGRGKRRWGGKGGGAGAGAGEGEGGERGADGEGGGGEGITGGGEGGGEGGREGESEEEGAEVEEVEGTDFEEGTEKLLREMERELSTIEQVVRASSSRGQEEL
ncbi:unnamed protein product [Closterium sp. Naga37s-1]|nr:unnamed protein product [Closterium sp. Naga37s-1]